MNDPRTSLQVWLIEVNDRYYWGPPFRLSTVISWWGITVIEIVSTRKFRMMGVWWEEIALWNGISIREREKVRIHVLVLDRHHFSTSRLYSLVFFRFLQFTAGGGKGEDHTGQYYSLREGTGQRHQPACQGRPGHCYHGLGSGFGQWKVRQTSIQRNSINVKISKEKKEEYSKLNLEKIFGM